MMSNFLVPFDDNGVNLWKVIVFNQPLVEYLNSYGFSRYQRFVFADNNNRNNTNNNTGNNNTGNENVNNNENGTNAGNNENVTNTSNNGNGTTNTGNDGNENTDTDSGNANGSASNSGGNDRNGDDNDDGDGDDDDDDDDDDYDGDEDNDDDIDNDDTDDDEYDDVFDVRTEVAISLTVGSESDGGAVGLNIGTKTDAGAVVFPDRFGEESNDNNFKQNYSDMSTVDSESDSDEDNFVANEEDLAMVKEVDKLAKALKNVRFHEIVPNSYHDIVATVPNVRILRSNDHIVSLQTLIRNKDTPRDEFLFNADRLIRIVIEAGLNHLPYTFQRIATPTGEKYRGLLFHKMNCGVSIERSGEAMEKALRDCCRAIRIGKILIQSDEDHRAEVLYCKFPADLPLRKILLLYPIMATGNTVIKAVKTLLKHGAKQSNIILVNLFSTPEAIRLICTRFHEMIVQTTEVHPIVPHHFGKKYFGTG